MPIRAKLPGALASHIGGNTEIELQAQTVDQALSALQQRHPSLVPLLRNESGKDRIYRVNYKDIIKGKDFSQNIVLRADDTVIVP